MQSYQDLIRDIMATGEGHDDRTGVGTQSIFGYQWRHDMRTGFPLLTTKRLPFRWVFEELMWFLSGSTDEHALRAKGVDIWKEWATAEKCAEFGREEGDLGPVYGYLWRNFGGVTVEGRDYRGVDQINNLLSDLDKSPNSRRLIVTGWHPTLSKEVALPPCHTLWQVKVQEDNSLSLSLYARSIDSFLGLPFNIASYALLLSLLAGVTGRKPRDLVISFGDLHLYSNHREQAAEQLDRVPRDLPTLQLDIPEEGAPLERLLAMTWDRVQLRNYDPHPKIEADVAV